MNQIKNEPEDKSMGKFFSKAIALKGQELKWQLTLPSSPVNHLPTCF